MKDTSQNEVDEKLIDTDKKRIFARVVSKQLTNEDLKRVSGGEAEFDCTYTNYPSADVSCDF